MSSIHEQQNKNIINQQGSLNYQVLKGKELEPFLIFIQENRPKLYRDFPYFYSALLDDQYVSIYFNVPEAFMVGAFRDNKLVGWVIGLPLKNVDFPGYSLEGEEVIPDVVKFKNAGIDLSTCFYASEVVMFPEYRTQSLAEDLYIRFEQAIKGVKKYTNIAFFHLDLGDTHLRRPKNFVDIEKNIFQAHNFVKNDCKIKLEWDAFQEDGSIKPQQKFAMDLWVKRLELA